MSTKRIGKQTLMLANPPAILGWANAGGKHEGEGPLGAEFDHISQDAYFGTPTWEKAEAAMMGKAFATACIKAEVKPSELDMVFAGDLQSQCTASSMMLRDYEIPFFGLFGACSTMSESLALASMCIDGGYAERAAAITSSHFCSAERQFRMPLEYGGQRCPNSQRTATAAGAIVVGSEGRGPRVTYITPGIIRDSGLTDSTNMGAAMAPAAFETLKAHFEDVPGGHERYDLIVTGDLAFVGYTVVDEFFKSEGISLTNYNDCGLMLYSRADQHVDSGGSGCGCSAAVLCGHILNQMRDGKLNKVLFAGTGALMSAVSSGQGESVPGICHAVAIEN